MKNNLLLTFLLFAFILFKVNAQLNTAYFDKLKTKPEISTDLLVWKQFGPGMAGYCEEFWTHPTDEKVMFMSPDMGNSYGTWDNGNSWQTIEKDDDAGRDLRRVQSIVFSRQDPNFGISSNVRGELYETHNQGKTWDSIKSFDGDGRYSELAVDPSNDNYWYLGAGDFWNVKFNHRSKKNTLGYVYTYSAYGHIYKSTNKGKTWKKITAGLPKTLDVGKIIVDPRNSNHIIAATNSGIYTSTNQGESWVLGGAGLPNNIPRDMSSYFNKTTNEFVLYVLEQAYYEADGNSIKSNGGVFKSTDGGLNWTSITGNLAIDLTKINNYNTESKYWRAISYWFDITQTEAKAMYPQLPNSILPLYNRMAVNPTNKNEIYLSTNVKHDFSFGIGDVWKTIDGGLNWFPTARTGTYWNQEKDKSYWQSRNSPLGMNTKFAHLQHEMETGEEAYGNRFLEVNLKGEVFICLDQQTLRSNDNGATWEQIDDYETSPGSKHWYGRGGSNLPGRFMLLETGVKNRKLFCSGEHGLWKTASLDGVTDPSVYAIEQIEGQNNENGAHSIASVAVNPKDPNMIYILMFRQSHRDEFRRSTDGGKTWSNISTPINYPNNDLSGDMMFQYSLTVDYDNPNNIYFCLISNAIAEVSTNGVPTDFNEFGVYKSTDGGFTWSIKNNGFPTGASVRRIIMDPDNSSTLYAALNEGKNNVTGGLFKSVNKGETWIKMEIPSPIKAVNNIFIDRNTKQLYISCGRFEGNFEEGGVWRSIDKGSSWNKIFDMPYIWQTETSPVNSNIITVNCALQHENKGVTKFNPGAYMSNDDGKTWIKMNRNLGQQDQLTDFKPDPEIENVFWIAQFGSGWSRGVYNGKLSDNSFDIKTTSTTCKNSANGQISITAKTNKLFNVKITGNGLNKSADFTTTHDLINLAAGIYSITITAADDPNFKQEYQLEIAEPEALVVQSKIDNISKYVNLSLSGSEQYQININGKINTTLDSSISLPLENGINLLEVKGKLECQGLFKKELFIGEDLIAYPNPVTDNLTIELGSDTENEVLLQIQNSIGTLILSSKKAVIQGKINCNITTLKSGVYLLTVKTSNGTKSFKIIKS